MQLTELAALVSRQASDLDVYAGFVLSALQGAVPADLIRVERHGSMLGRARGREPRVVAVSVRLEDAVFVLRRDHPGSAPHCEIQHEVGGIVLSRAAVGLAEWSNALAGALQALAHANDEAAAALSRLTSFTV